MSEPINKHPELTRKNARELAKHLGIDTSGMTTKEMREVISTELHKQEKEMNKAKNEMSAFAKRLEAVEKAVNRGPDPPAAPKPLSGQKPAKEPEKLPQNRGAIGIDPMATREEIREMADWLGIDTSGFPTQELREAVDTELRKQAKAKQAVDDINEFARKQSAKNDAINRGVDSPAAPKVISTVIETRETMGLPESRPRPQSPPTIQSGGGTVGGAFCTLITVSSEGDDNGDIYLQGGTINGLPVANILLYDALPTPTWSAADGYFLWVPLTGTFEVVDGVALPGFTASSAGSPFWGTSATDTFPAVTSASSASNGICNVNLGVMGTDTFYPSGCGNRIVSLCITPPYTGDV